MTELVFMLDKRGSIGGLESDTLGEFKSMLQKQKAVDGERRITTVLFGNNYALLHDRIDIRAFAPITKKKFYVGGSTALLAAIGKTIHKAGTSEKHTAENYRAEKVLFVIITDRQENARREYSSDQVKAQIERQKKEYSSWDGLSKRKTAYAFVLSGHSHTTRDACLSQKEICYHRYHHL